MTTPGDDQWVFLIDPAWPAPEPAAHNTGQDADDVEVADAENVEVQGPPIEAVVGGWLVTADGTVGPFSANPDYRPSQPGSPTDPVDATLQLLVRGEVDSDALFAVIRESVFDVALDEDGRPIIAPSPDDVPSLLVSTAPAQRFRVQTDNWRAQVTAAELGDLLREHEVDVLINPGGPASIRLIGSVFAENL
ncbi:type VII secretion system-associated protein, partial [Lentzea sp. NPDC006480]|uniref:type VII secretion system-associated protein n=1 Tax=Lentzea sp. NPDC006480 TaxID=3157176 RepID=UPI0033A9D0A1